MSATDTIAYPTESSAYGDAHPEIPAGARVPIGGGVIFLAFAWILAFAFWLFAMSEFVGIMDMAMQSPP
jgi:hypothetical protein